MIFISTLLFFNICKHFTCKRHMQTCSPLFFTSISHFRYCYQVIDQIWLVENDIILSLEPLSALLWLRQGTYWAFVKKFVSDHDHVMSCQPSTLNYCTSHETLDIWTNDKCCCFSREDTLGKTDVCEYYNYNQNLHSTLTELFFFNTN